MVSTNMTVDSTWHASVLKSDHKLNVILCGIDECNQGLSKSARQQEDLNNVFSSTVDTINLS